MAKSLNSLWLKTARRLGKAQQAQGRRLFKSLLPKALRAPLVRRAKAAKTLKLAGRKAIQRSRQPPRVPARAMAGLPGVWKMSYFSLPAAGQLAPGRRMLYWLYLPASGASAAAGAALPLVVMLHGCQQTAADFATSTRMNRLAERKGFAVLYPQQSATADAHRCWHWYQRTTQQQGLGEAHGDVRLIAEMTAQVQRQHGLDRSRTYLAGLSAGAALATLVALRYPGMIAALGLHSAPVFGTSDSAISALLTMQRGSGHALTESARRLANSVPPFPGMPAILIHGERDAVVRPVNLLQLSRQFEVLNGACISGAEPQRRSYPARSAGRSPRHAWQSLTYYAGKKPQLMRCEIAVLGHAWSGGDPSVAFSAREGPDATLMMWNFFARHRRGTEP